MRTIINISLPKEMAKFIKQEARDGGFASTSEFIRHVIRSWNTLRLAEQLKKDTKLFEQGKGKVLRSLKDLR
ncbi:MAG: ribbon-helix-helix domain-containing protein [Candidatus Pacebacteria bacterium]|nr:ribbon-helix-helix domain-containing protein [Candidatus Paceibacterota bacterium]